MYKGWVVIFFCIALAGCNATRKPTVLSNVGTDANADIPDRPTYNTDPYAPVPDPVYSETPKWVIYTYEPADYLVGNRCVVEYTHAMGFEYSPAFRYPDEDIDPVKIWFHNQAIKLKLVWHHGPWWSTRVRRRIADCKRASGDFSA